MNQIEEKKDIGPIFIFAASWRTGSTLLQRVLNASNQIFIFGETGGEPSFISRFRALCENQKKYLEKVSWNREQTNLNKKGQWIPIFNPPPENIYKSAKYFFDNLYSLQSINMNQKSIWGIKEVRDSAYEDSLFLKKLYPNAKFIYLIRNPFDMYISLKAKEGIFNNFKENRPFYPIEVWNNNVSFFLNEEKMKEIDGFLIKYEDIIEPSNSRTLLDELVKYLSIEFHDKMLEELSVKVGNSSNKNKLNKKEVQSIYKIIEQNNRLLKYTVSNDKIKQNKWFSF